MSRLLTDSSGRQWTLDEVGFAGDQLSDQRVARSRDEFSRVHLVFNSIDGKERRTIWKELPLDVQAVSVEELRDWLREAKAISR